MLAGCTASGMVRQDIKCARGSLEGSRVPP